MLASELGISLRSLYRDIGTLKEQGACIEGEPGMGYVLRPGFTLPPLMFAEDEIEALVLGARWVAERGDPRLGAAASVALSKIAAVLPEPLRLQLDTSALLIGPGAPVITGEVELGDIRTAIRLERKLQFSYRDAEGKASTRVIWPFGLGFFEQVRLVMGWCELRGQFRHFRADRIFDLVVSDQRYPRRRQVLMKEWQDSEIARSATADKNG